MSPYCLHCTVCKDNFNSLLEWNAHLPEINHQRRAKLQCRKWKAFNKECVIVVFGSCPVVDCGLVQQLSSGIGGEFVTDFIFWRKKPNIGLLQFESSDSVDVVLRKTGPEIWIDDIHRVQLRKAVDYYDLEWSFLFSLSAASKEELYSFNDDDLPQNTTTIKKEVVPKKKRTRKSTASENPEVNTKKKRKSSNNEIYVSTENNEARKECRTIDDETKIPKKKKKKKASTKSTEENPQVPPCKTKKLKKAVENNSDHVPEPAEQQEQEVEFNSISKNEAPPQSCTEVRQSICEETSPALNNETLDLVTSDAASEGEPELTEEHDALDTDQIDQRTSPVPEINSEMQSAISTSVDIEGTSCPPTNADQSDTNSTDTEVVILSSDESDDEENNIIMAEGKEDDKEQQNHIPNNDNYDADAEEQNSILGSFRKEYISLIQHILIPSDEYQNVVNLIEMLESEFKKTVPECRVIPFRHWHLGIKSAGTNELLLFLDYSGIWGKEEWNEATYDPIKPFIINKFFRSPGLVFSEIQKASKFQKVKKCVNPNEESFGAGFLHVPSGLKFRVIDSPLLLHEVQTSRLMQYLCEFDPIVLPVLGLLNYWANANSLMFGNLRVTNPSTPSVSPFPASLNWLVLLFLMKKKVIPSAREILSEPHKKIICRGKDLGFSDDPDYPKTWSGSTIKPLQLSEQIARLRNTDDIELYSLPRIVRMLQIVKDFFSFYRTNVKKIGFNRGIIFNPKDGNILTKFDIMNLNKKLAFDNSERNILKATECFTKHDVCILHPIDFSKFCLSFNSEIFRHVLFPLMELTMKKIRKFLSSLRKGKIPQTSLSQLFKANRDNIKKKGKRLRMEKKSRKERRLRKVRKVKPKPIFKKKVKSKNGKING